MKDGSNQSFKEIDIDVEERPTGEISLTAGFGTTGETIGAGIKENNFLGKGIKLNTNLELTADSIKVNLFTQNLILTIVIILYLLQLKALQLIY